MRHKYQGFTLIELMIVVVIIGILATCAIPAYQHYVIRARVTEGLTLATSAKLMVAESLIEQRGQEHSVFGLGFRPPAPTENVAAVAIHPQTGAITITFTPLAGDGSIIIHPKVLSSGQITWDCKEGNLDKAYRPASCR